MADLLNKQATVSATGVLVCAGLVVLGLIVVARAGTAPLTVDEAVFGFAKSRYGYTFLGILLMAMSSAAMCVFSILAIMRGKVWCLFGVGIVATCWLAMLLFFDLRDYA